MEGKENIRGRIEDVLKHDPDNGYTIMGLMVRFFGVNEKDIDGKPFSEWPTGAPSKYTRIRTVLEKLKKEGIIKSIKSGKAVYYWWADHQ